MNPHKSDRHLDPHLSCCKVCRTLHIAFNRGCIGSHSWQHMCLACLLQVFWKIRKSQDYSLKQDHTHSVIPFRAEVTHKDKAVTLAQIHAGFALYVTLQCFSIFLCSVSEVLQFLYQWGSEQAVIPQITVSWGIWLAVGPAVHTQTL